MISDIHIRGIRRIANTEIVAIVDSDLRRAREKAEQYAIPAVFATQSEMLQAAKPHVCHLLTPPATHADLCVEALEAGAHVYVEKPMAASVADCERMIAAAERSGRELCVGHCLVYDPLVRRALDLVESGELGEPTHAAGVYCFDTARIPGYDNKRWYRALAGGFLEDLAAHPASVLVHLLGNTHTVARSLAGSVGSHPEQRRDSIAAVIGAERGTASIFVSLDARPEEVSVDIYCTRGTARINLSTMVMAVEPDRKVPRKIAHGIRNFAMAKQLATQTVTHTVQFLRGRLDATKGIHTLIAEFYQALAAGEPAPVPGEEGRRVVEILRSLWPEPAPVRPSRWVLSSPGVNGDGGREVKRAPAASASGNGAGNGAGEGAGLSALVTGATGFIGTHLVRSLAERGVRVRAFARNPDRARKLIGPGVEVVIGDMADPGAIAGLAEGMDVVFHLASVMKGTHDEFERVDIAGGRRLIAEAKRAGAKRFVFTSTMGAYALGGLRDGAVVTEEMIDLPDRVGPYSRAKLLMERDLAEVQRSGEMETVVVRPGLVFGDGITPYLSHLPHMGSLRGDRYVMFGDGRVPLQLTYVGNTVDALWLCATSPEAPGETFTIIDDGLPTQREYVRRLAELTGRPLRVTTIPRPAAWLIGLGVERAAGVMKRKPPTTRRLLVGKTVKLSFDCSRAKRLLGWTPRVRWDEGLRRAVEWDSVRRGGATITG
jgi:nucleoside-diphosphate-sugar epimerase/predicted dehydrogenase